MPSLYSSPHVYPDKSNAMVGSKARVLRTRLISSATFSVLSSSSRMPSIEASIALLATSSLLYLIVVFVTLLPAAASSLALSCRVSGRQVRRSGFTASPRLLRLSALFLRVSSVKVFPKNSFL